MTKPRKNGWTDEETRFLIDNYSKMSIGEIAKHLRRTKSSVSSKGSSLGLKAEERRGLWSPEECDFLLKNYEKMTQGQIAEKLGRSRGATSCKLRELCDLHGIERKQAPRKKYITMPKKERLTDAPPQYKYDVKPGDVVVAKYTPATQRRTETSNGRTTSLRSVVARCTVLAVYKNIFIVNPEGSSEEVSLRRNEWVNGHVKRVRSEQKETKNEGLL